MAQWRARHALQSHTQNRARRGKSTDDAMTRERLPNRRAQVTDAPASAGPG
jgi:hypothetical protein